MRIIGIYWNNIIYYNHIIMIDILLYYGRYYWFDKKMYTNIYLVYKI